ncbi:MAG: hypothetical protein GY855_08740, partial [candidate division Zixibacteria bacterium]|nr:hypothetical protein [candidate division Zixibacteria bacterium]
MYSFKNSVGIKNCLTLCILMAMAVSVVWNPAFAQQNPSYSENIITWDQPFFPNGIYNDDIPKPEEVIGFPLGKKPIKYIDMVKYMEALSEESPIVLLKEHGVTHEGRKLYHFIISSHENIERLEEIRASIGKIADPRTLDSKQDAGKIINNTP